MRDAAGNEASTVITVIVTIAQALFIPEIAARTYAAGQTIANLQLPPASGGVPNLTYQITLPENSGFTFDSGTRTLGGTPSLAAGDYTIPYRVTDSTGRSFVRNITVTITAVGYRFAGFVDDSVTITADTLAGVTGESRVAPVR